MKNQKTKFSLKIISFFKFIFISQILLAVILSSDTAEAKGFELYGIGLDTPVEQIERIAKEKKFELMASNKIEQQYKLEHYSVNKPPFDALVDILTLSPKYNENLFTLLKKANDTYIRESGMGDFSSFIDEKYLGKIYVIIGKNPDYNEKIECTFFDINGKPAMVEMRIWTLKTALLRDIIENYTKQYGKPQFIGANTPDADTPFDRKKPLNEYAEYIWKLNNEICKIGIRWSNTSGKLVIYNPEVISELMNSSIKTAQDIIDGNYTYRNNSGEKKDLMAPKDYLNHSAVDDNKYTTGKFVLDENTHKKFMSRGGIYALADNLLNVTCKLLKIILPDWYFDDIKKRSS